MIATIMAWLGGVDGGGETSFLHQVSILPKFYVRLFCTKVFCAAFLLLQFGFVIFWCKNIGAKAVTKMLMKLTNILCVVFYESFTFSFILC